MPGQNWNVNDWLRNLGLERYAPAFRDAEVTAEVLPELTDADLCELGLPLGPRRAVLKAIRDLADVPKSPDVGAARADAGPGVSPVPSEAERRQLTVMFVDLVGSTALASTLDPEDTDRVLRVYRTRCAEVVRHWGGHVAKYLGDGVLAYFGYPEAHEDDAERAVRTGLDLGAAIGHLEVEDGGMPLSIRVGIATGLVVVGELIGEGAAREEVVVGETPNLAARLQALAEPGTVVVAERTRRLLGNLFDFVDLGRHHFKGFAVPLQAWRAVGIGETLSRFEALRPPRQAPLIGRTRELELLANALQQAAAGRGQVVAAAGEPGVGKSRLFDAFLRSSDLVGWDVLSCGCRPYGSSTPWLPVIDLVKDVFGIQARDEREPAILKVDAGLAPFGTFARPARVALASLIGLVVEDHEWRALDPPQRRRRILDAVKGLLLLRSEHAPLILVVEDLHWADSETLALLDGLVEGVAARRALLLVNYRPEFRHEWVSRTYYSQLLVDPLEPERAAELLADLLGEDSDLAALKRELVGRTAGNPLFLEEAVRDLAETGALAGAPGAYRLMREVGAVRVPESVQAILAARIDRLPREAKHVVQRAAVIGQDVPLPVLARISDLDPLRSATDPGDGVCVQARINA